MLKDLLCNEMFVCGTVGYFLAQFIKVFTMLYRERCFDWHRFFASGGMPSSHAATVCALAISCARVCGIGSPQFAICFFLAAIVMYDASGVRRAAGEHAKMLNQIMADLFSGDPAYAEKALKEMIGHTPLQVIMGALLGILVGVFMPSLAPLFV